MATMLHWLAGAKTVDNVDDTAIETPDTPAPVFAVKAFRHALFGTPQTQHRPQPRRHSTADNRPRNFESPKPTRPRMDRPKSANDANGLMPPASPTKGILMTPGTAAAKKKNVTFGDHVVDNQDKRPMKSGLPDDCPGKFPSPWAKTSDAARDGSPNKGRGRSQLTEALEKVRDESRQRQNVTGDDCSTRATTGEEVGMNECCEHWRREYEVYRTNTQREVKKLVKKYQTAKSYAQDKDDEASDLRLHLKEAETKADALEEAVNLLTAQIKEMEEKLRSKSSSRMETEIQGPVTQAKERDRPRDLQSLLERRAPKERTASSTTVKTTENDDLQRPSEPRPAASRRAFDRDELRQKNGETIGASTRTSKERPGSKDGTSTVRESTRSTTAGRTPAGIAARRAANTDAPAERWSELANTTTNDKLAAEPFGPRRKPSPTDDAFDRETTRALPKQPPAPSLTPEDQAQLCNPAEPPPGDLFLPSDPAIYSTSPPLSQKPLPQLPPPSKTQSHTRPQLQPTVEDKAPPPPLHAPKRQDSGLGSGGTLKAISGNARSGNVAAEGESKDGRAVSGLKLGRDGKPPDEARIEAAKMRLRGRGREVS